MIPHPERVFHPLSDRCASRREFLTSSAKTIGGLAVPAVLAQRVLGSSRSGTNKSVLFVFLAGGPSQLDTYDMKPDAPAEIRGEFRPVQTNVPGLRVCEHLPLHAKIAGKFAIVNGMQTIDSHGPAVVTTGRVAREEHPGLTVASSVRLQSPGLPGGDWDTHGRVLGRDVSIFQELRDKLPVY